MLQIFIGLLTDFYCIKSKINSNRPNLITLKTKPEKHWDNFCGQLPFFLKISTKKWSKTYILEFDHKFNLKGISILYNQFCKNPFQQKKTFAV